MSLELSDIALFKAIEKKMYEEVVKPATERESWHIRVLDNNGNIGFINNIYRGLNKESVVEVFFSEDDSREYRGSAELDNLTFLGKQSLETEERAIKQPAIPNRTYRTGMQE